MTHTCSFENTHHMEFSIKSLKSQTNIGETKFYDMVLLLATKALRLKTICIIIRISLASLKKIPTLTTKRIFFF